MTPYYKIFSYISSLLVMFAGFIVLIGFQFEIDLLKSFYSDGTKMGAGTAATFFLTGIAIIAIQSSRRYAPLLARFLGLIIMLVGIFSLYQNLFDQKFKIDEFLFGVSTGTGGILFPNLTALITGVNFLLLGFSFTLITIPKFQHGFLVEFLLVFSLTLSILELFGHLTGLAVLTGSSGYTKMAINTTGTFIIVCLAILFALHEQQRTPLTIAQKLFAGLTTASALIILITFLSISSIRSLVQISNTIEQTHELKDKINTIFTHVLEVQSGDRGFILTLNERYLVEQSKSFNKLSELLNTIRSQTVGNPRQQMMISSLENLVSKRTALSSLRTSTIRNKGKEKALLLFPVEDGKAVTDSIRTLIAQMLAEENRLLQIRNKYEIYHANLNRLIIGIGLAVQLLLLAFTFIVVNRDVIGRKHADAALRESEKRYRSLFDSIDEGFCIIEVLFDGNEKAIDYRFLETNPSFVKHTGLTDARGKTMREIAPSHEEYWFEIYGKIALTGKPARFENRAEQLHRWYDVYAFRFNEPEQRQVAILFNDITDRRKAEEVILTSKTQLETVNKELEAFSYSVSHDLRAPLRHIDGFAQLLHKKYYDSLNEQAQRYLDNISGAAKKMGQLIDELLVFSRMGRTELRTSTVGMDGIVQGVIDELVIDSDQRNVKIEKDRLPDVECDPSMIRLVWVNLLSNAYKYTGKIEKATIQIGYQMLNGEIVFSVKDNGAGFDMKYADKLFGVFQRLHRSDDFEGIGIGLANVRRIVERHHGRAWAEGETGKGATFYFSLPFKG